MLVIFLNIALGAFIPHPDDLSLSKRVENLDQLIRKNQDHVEVEEVPMQAQFDIPQLLDSTILVKQKDDTIRLPIAKENYSKPR